MRNISLVARAFNLQTEGRGLKPRLSHTNDFEKLIPTAFLSSTRRVRMEGN